MSVASDFQSPRRDRTSMPKQPMMSGTPTSPPVPDPSMYPWNWGDGASAIDLSPASSNNGSPDLGRDLKRGRPRADAITTLIVEGTRINSDIRCKICNRVFPRDKSLQAHMRTHTGERPYQCDYPGCDKSFCQSGQLKTHQRLHTGEKPFACSVPGCTSRFAHANRHCADHPRAALKRDNVANFTPSKTEQSPEVLHWLDRHLQKRQDRTPNRPRSRAIKRSLNLQQDIENRPIHMDVKNLPLASPPPKKFGTNSQYSRASVIKHAKNADQDMELEEQNEMGVERLQPQTTPLKSACLTPRHLAPLQNVPLNLTSPVTLHPIQPQMTSQMKQSKSLPLPLIPPNLTVLENAPKNISSAEQLLSLQNHQQVQVPHLQSAASSKYGAIDLLRPQIPGIPNFSDIQACFTTPPRKVVSRATEERDTLLGALALVELSQSPQ